MERRGMYDSREDSFQLKQFESGGTHERLMYESETFIGSKAQQMSQPKQQQQQQHQLPMNMYQQNPNYYYPATTGGVGGAGNEGGSNHSDFYAGTGFFFQDQIGQGANNNHNNNTAVPASKSPATGMHIIANLKPDSPEPPRKSITSEDARQFFRKGGACDFSYDSDDLKASEFSGSVYRPSNEGVFRDGNEENGGAISQIPLIFEYEEENLSRNPFMSSSVNSRSDSCNTIKMNVLPLSSKQNLDQAGSTGANNVLPSNSKQTQSNSIIPQSQSNTKTAAAANKKTPQHPQIIVSNLGKFDHDDYSRGDSSPPGLLDYQDVQIAGHNAHDNISFGGNSEQNIRLSQFNSHTNNQQNNQKGLVTQNNQKGVVTQNNNNNKQKNNINSNNNNKIVNNNNNNSNNTLAPKNNGISQGNQNNRQQDQVVSAANRNPFEDSSSSRTTVQRLPQITLNDVVLLEQESQKQQQANNRMLRAPNDSNEKKIEKPKIKNVDSITGSLNTSEQSPPKIHPLFLDSDRNQASMKKQQSVNRPAGGTRANLPTPPPAKEVNDAANASNKKPSPSRRISQEMFVSEITFKKAGDSLKKSNKPAATTTPAAAATISTGVAAGLTQMDPKSKPQYKENLLELDSDSENIRKVTQLLEGGGSTDKDDDDEDDYNDCQNEEDEEEEDEDLFDDEEEEDEFDISLELITCQMNGHNEEKIIFVCVDPACSAEYRICCGYCSPLHSSHAKSLMRVQEYRKSLSPLYVLFKAKMNNIFEANVSPTILQKSNSNSPEKKQHPAIEHKDLEKLCRAKQREMEESALGHFAGLFSKLKKQIGINEAQISVAARGPKESQPTHLRKSLARIRKNQLETVSNADIFSLFSIQKSPKLFVQFQQSYDAERKKMQAELDGKVYAHYVALQAMFNKFLVDSSSLCSSFVNTLKATQFGIPKNQSQFETVVSEVVVTRERWNNEGINSPSKSPGKKRNGSNQGRSAKKWTPKSAARKGLSPSPCKAMGKQQQGVEKSEIQGYQKIPSLPKWCLQLPILLRCPKKLDMELNEERVPVESSSFLLIENPSYINYNSISPGIMQNMKDQSVYIGKWRENKKFAFGVEYCKSNSSFYKGNWLNNLKNGIGRLISKNDAMYEGEFKNDKKNGFGTQYHLGRKQFEGMWKDGALNGEAVQYLPNGDIFKGEFRNGIKEGRGIMKYMDGTTLEGTWQKDIMNGHCSLTKKDGSMYSGQYVNGKREGLGTFTWADKKKYVGMWKDGQQHGEGEFTNSQGITVQGKWENGVRVKTLQYDNSRSPA